MSPFRVFLSPWFPPCSTRHDCACASIRRLHALAATVWRKLLGLTLGSLTSPWGFWGIPRRVGLPPSVVFGDFRGLTFGPVGLRVACLLHLHSASCAPFSSWLGFLPSFFSRLWDRIPRVLWDTLADESFSPRQTDGELLVLMCLHHGTAEEGRQLGGEPAIRPSSSG